MGVVENHMLYQKSAVFVGRASCSDSVCSGNISVIVFALRRSAVSGWAIRSRAHAQVSAGIIMTALPLCLTLQCAL